MQPLRLVSTVRRQWIELREGQTIVVGRAPTSDLAVLDPTISRQHAELSVEHHRVTLRDIGSSNGTFVNGKRVAEVTVDRGDIITFGRIDFELLDAEAPARVERSDDGFAPPAALSTETAIVRSVTVGTLGGHDGGEEGRPDHLPRLLDISRDLARHTGIDALLERIVDITFERMNVDSASLLFRDRETGVLVPGLTKSRLDPDPGSVHVPSSIASRVVSECIAILTDNAAADVRFKGQSIVAHQVRSAMCVPLIQNDGTVLGVFYADNRTATRSFDDDDLVFLIAFSGLAATAIENNRVSGALRHDAVLRAALGRSFAPDLVDHIAANPTGTILRSGAREIVALAVQITGLDPAATTVAPDAIARMLAHYVDETVDIAFAHGATVNREPGGTVMAFWGVPTTLNDEPDRAVRAALEMRQRLSVLAAGWSRSLNSEIGVRIGVTSGLAFAGDIGTADQPAYVVVGRPVDLARWLSAAAAPGEVLLAGPVVTTLAAPPPIEQLAPRVFAGDAEPIPVYRVRQ